MDRSEKAEAVAELNQIFKDANLMVVTHQYRSDGPGGDGPAPQGRGSRRQLQGDQEPARCSPSTGTKFDGLGRCSPGRPRSLIRRIRWRRRRSSSTFAKRNEKLDHRRRCARREHAGRRRASRPSPPCRRSMRLRGKISASCRPRRPGSPASCRRRPVRSHVCSQRMRAKKTARRPRKSDVSTSHHEFEIRATRSIYNG